jgi:FkbM family methyltransferase
MENPMPKLLWANMHCLVDHTSGASLSIRNMLKQLKRRGWDVRILGATCFDSEQAIESLPKSIKIKLFDYRNHRAFKLVDGELEHDIINTNTSDRDSVKSSVEQIYYKTFIPLLNEFKPDVVWAYGGRHLDALIAVDAQRSGAIAASYLVNGGYNTKRWAEDYDTIITDSNATKNLYKDRLNIGLNKIGKFVHSMNINPQSAPDNVLVINPSLEKGGLLIAQVAHSLQARNSSIKFHVAESRGNLNSVIDAVAKHYNTSADKLSKMFVNHGVVSDMANFYSNGKVLFAPSLWFESGSRALAECVLNGLPVITTNSGGNEEMIGNGGSVLHLPLNFYEKPFTKLLPNHQIEVISDLIERYLSEKEFYTQKQKLARRYGKTKHNAETNGYFLSQHFKSLIDAKRIGDFNVKRDGKFETENIIKTKCNIAESDMESFYQSIKKVRKKKLFVDCGGYDGCSAIKFLEKNPEFQCITFEPNPMLHEYYWDIPTHLVRACVSTSNGVIDLTLDMTDSDGSSIVDGKVIDIVGIVPNELAPRVKVDSIDLLSFLMNVNPYFEEIVVKLDIEGAEYDILNSMSDWEVWPCNFSTIHCEFHWEKIGMTYELHRKILEKILPKVNVYDDWDALTHRIAYVDSEGLVLNRRQILTKIAGK